MLKVVYPKLLFFSLQGAVETQHTDFLQDNETNPIAANANSKSNTSVLQDEAFSQYKLKVKR